MVICLERGADLHMAQLMPLPLTVSCFSKIQIGFTFVVPAHPGSPGERAVKRCVCVCVCVCVFYSVEYQYSNILLATGRVYTHRLQLSSVSSSSDGSVGLCRGRSSSVAATSRA